ncbi:LysR family transcriptional regulator [Nocardia sp. NPDC051911]|uniref:LysR family transcriptional regulator n=1 Tax=Nocardia sp. NPDC051911 TaxID=3154648 RepID=UPI003437AA0F
MTRDQTERPVAAPAQDRLRGLDLNMLDALDGLLRQPNLTYAGAAIGMTQPGMSVLLGKLRRRFADELLMRKGHDYHLTPLARDLIPAFQTALGLVRQTLRLEPAFAPARDDRVFTIAASDYATTVLHGPLLRALERDQARVRVQFVDVPDDLYAGPEILLRYDLTVAPLGMGVSGAHRFLFSDRLGLPGRA